MTAVLVAVWMAAIGPRWLQFLSFTLLGLGFGAWVWFVGQSAFAAQTRTPWRRLSSWIHAKPPQLILGAVALVVVAVAYLLLGAWLVVAQRTLTESFTVFGTVAAIGTFVLAALGAVSSAVAHPEFFFRPKVVPRLGFPSCVINKPQFLRGAGDRLMPIIPDPNGLLGSFSLRNEGRATASAVTVRVFFWQIYGIRKPEGWASVGDDTDRVREIQYSLGVDTPIYPKFELGLPNIDLAGAFVPAVGEDGSATQPALWIVVATGPRTTLVQVEIDVLDR